MNIIMVTNKKTRSVYVDIVQWEEWENWCDETGRVLNKVIPLAIEEYIKKNSSK